MTHWADRKAFEHVTARGVCQQCRLRIQCTRCQSARRAQASRTPRDFGQLGYPGTELPDPPALYGTIFCSRNTIRFEASTLGEDNGGTNSGLLDSGRAEHPTAYCSSLAKAESGTHRRCWRVLLRSLGHRRGIACRSKSSSAGYKSSITINYTGLVNNP
jgi:hypothetical protein